MLDYAVLLSDPAIVAYGLIVCAFLIVYVFPWESRHFGSDRED